MTRTSYSSFLSLPFSCNLNKKIGIVVSTALIVKYLFLSRQNKREEKRKTDTTKTDSCICNVSITGVELSARVSLTGSNLVSLTGDNYVSLTGNSIVSLNNNQADAFGRLRVSETFTLLDVSNTVGNNTGVIDNLFTGSGTGFFDPNNSCFDLQVTNTIPGTATRQSRRYAIYQPGKSLLVQITGVLCLDTFTNNFATSRIGYFDDKNGYFFEYNGATLSLSLVERFSVNGSVQENRVIQSLWNLPLTMAPYILDTSKAQIFIFDFQWLGVGRVRCGLVHNGVITYVYEFLHDNITTQTYTTTMNLPIRYEIRNDSITSPNPTTAVLRQICGTVISEGGYNPVGQIYSIALPTQVSVSSSVETLLLAIRIKTPNNSPVINKNRTNVIPGLFEILSGNNSANLQYSVRLYRAPSLGNLPVTGGVWTSTGIGDSACEYNFTGTFNTSPVGNIISQGYVSGKTIKNVSEDLTFAFKENNQLTCNIDGSLSDYFVLTAISLDNASNTYATFNWREIF